MASSPKNRSGFPLVLLDLSYSALLPILFIFKKLGRNFSSNFFPDLPWLRHEEFVLNFTFGELGIRDVIESNLWVNSKEKKILTLKIWMFYNFYQRGNLPMSEFIKHQQHSLSSDFHVFLSQHRKTEEPDLSVSKKTCKQSAVQPFAHNVRKFRSIATLYGYFKMLSCAAPKAQRPKSMGRCEEFLLNFVPYWTWGTQYRCE